MKNINLYEILKGHEGEIFYCPFYGDVKLDYVNDGCVGFSSVIDCGNSCVFAVNDKGLLMFNDTVTNSECVVFPSKEQRDWNVWLEEHKLKPKIWNEIEDNINDTTIAVDNLSSALPITTNHKVIKSALAFLKIHQLIEIGYGGNITDEEWKEHTKTKYTIDLKDKKLICSYTYHFKSHIAFHTKEQAEEFLSYIENVQLLKDYFMI